MACNYSFTKIAIKDLDDIITYISQDLSNASAAKKLFDRIKNTIDSLCKFPKLYKVVENQFLTRKDVRKVVIDSYLLYYIYDEKNNLLIILRIVYGKRNQEDILRKI